MLPIKKKLQQKHFSSIFQNLNFCFITHSFTRIFNYCFAYFISKIFFSLTCLSVFSLPQFQIALAFVKIFFLFLSRFNFFLKRSYLPLGQADYISPRSNVWQDIYRGKPFWNVPLKKNQTKKPLRKCAFPPSQLDTPLTWP